MFAVCFVTVRRRKYCILINIENTVPFGGTLMTTGLFSNGYPATVPFDAPNITICSMAEIEAVTPSTELQAYKNMNVS